MNNSEYWEQRVANETWRTYNSLEEKNRDLLKMYQEASLDLQEELYQVTQKINGGQGVSLSDMHKHNRLTNLQKNMEYRIRQLGEDVEKFGKDNMKSGIKDVYSNVIGSLDISNFSLPNEKLMEKMFNTPWQSDTFSNRLWKNTQKLATNLNDILTIGLTQGKTVTEMAINLNNQMNQGFNVSHRLIRTETMHYLNESAFKAYEDGGCTEVQLWAAEDERMCEVCGKKHGQKYTLKDRPTLPLHANCRCTYLPVVDMNKVEENNRVIQEQIERIKELEKNVSKFGKSDIMEERNVSQRNMANGNRKSAKVKLSDNDKKHLLREIEAINADQSVFEFRDGYGSGYSDSRDIIYISSNILPSNDNSLHPRDLMSERAALAHEYYGHRANRGTDLEKGSWNDEFRASYMAAKNCPNLSDYDRMYLILDAIERAKEAGVSIKYNDFMRGVLYGH